MPTIEDNIKEWAVEYDWSNQGDEWSVGYGGPFMQWYGSILPRIHRFVPADNILEIACGCGRWTQFLKNICDNLVAIDLSEECIQECKRRFSESSNIKYYSNDGKSLEMIDDNSIDFIFSFDSLVHVNESVLRSYISQFHRILKNDGAAFLHHSNLGEYSSMYSNIRRIPKLEGVLIKLGILEKLLHNRDTGVTAKIVEELAEAHGLKCISQEIVPWGTKRTHIDCLSTIVKSTSPLATNNQILRNSNFTQEARNLHQLSNLYKARQ